MSSGRCPVCGSDVDIADTACRHCGAGLPNAPTIATPTEAEPAGAAGALNVLETELREALAPAIQLLRPLGEGGMGHVWLARDPALKRHVAVKVLHPELANDPASRARFAREAEAAAAVAHPGVVGIHQVGELPRSGTAYFVMQFVEGRSLQEEIATAGAMPEPRLRRIVGEIASALAAAHARGVVHRDIKPANVMLDGESGRVVVLDFGISAALERRAVPGATRLTVEGHSIGTPMYMSPEQAAAMDVTSKSDVYSLGIVAFELSTGRPPFTGETAMELVAAHIKDVPPKLTTLRSDLDPQLAELIDRCLAKSPQARPAAADIARALLPGAHAVIEWPPPGLEPLRGKGAQLAGMMGGMAGVGLLFFFLLVTQPILISPQWYVERFLAFDGTPVWYFALGMCLVALLLLVPLVMLQTWRMVTHLREGRRSGYPWQVLLDVMWDQQADTAALINGIGAYALIEESQRSRIVELRRRQAIIAVATIGVAMVSPLLWLTGLTSGWAGGTRLLAGPEVLTLLGPTVLGLALLAHSMRPEARLRSRLGAMRFGGAHRRDRVRAELVGAWLNASGRSQVITARSVSRAALAAAPSLLGIALLAAAGTVLLVTFEVSRRLASAREQARVVVNTMRTDSLRPMPWHFADSVIAVSARVPERGPIRLLRSDRVARARAVPDLVALRRASGFSIPTSALRFIGQNDTLAARALAEGDVAGAVQRERENIEVGRALLGTTQHAWTGRRIIGHAATRFMDIGRTSADPMLLAEGERLRSVIDGIFANQPRWFAGSLALMADPGGAGLLPYLRDTSLAPFRRAGFAQAVVYGYCMNAREVLLGVEPERRATFAQAVSALADVPQAAKDMQFWSALLDALLDNDVSAIVAARTPGAPGRSRNSGSLLKLLGLRGLQQRHAFCDLMLSVQ